MYQVWEYLDSDLTDGQIWAIARLMNEVWPSESRTLAEIVEAWRAEIGERKGGAVEDAQKQYARFVIWEGEKAIAHASTFPRQIYTPQGAITVMGLGGVCVDANRRGEGLGAAVMRPAFERVDRGLFPLSLYQTGVPGFYEKLGAKLVYNQFINSKNSDDPQKNPWWDTHVMIYPAHYEWADGTIDLNGFGY